MPALERVIETGGIITRGIPGYVVCTARNDTFVIDTDTGARYYCDYVQQIHGKLSTVITSKGPATLCFKMIHGKQYVTLFERRDVVVLDISDTDIPALYAPASVVAQFDDIVYVDIRTHLLILRVRY